MAEKTRRAEATWLDDSSRWCIRVQKDGKRKAFYSSEPSRKGKREAEAAADKWLETGKGGDMRFDELWALFLARTKEMTGTANYAQHEMMGRLWLLPQLEGTRLSKITMMKWQECIDAGYKHGLSKKSCMNIRASITAVCKFGRKMGLSFEPPDDLEIPKNAPVGKRKILQPKALDILLTDDMTIFDGKEQPEYFIHAFRFIVFTGLRRGEVCGLKKEDICGSSIDLKRSVNSRRETTSGKNDNARRDFEMPQKAMAALKAQYAMLKERGIESEYVFPAEDGKEVRPNTMYDHWIGYCEAQGFRCSLHELRHTMISVSKTKVPEALLKHLVGHSDEMKTFDVYGHPLDSDASKTAALIDAAFDELLLKDIDNGIKNGINRDCNGVTIH